MAPMRLWRSLFVAVTLNILVACATNEEPSPKTTTTPRSTTQQVEQAPPTSSKNHEVSLSG